MSVAWDFVDFGTIGDLLILGLLTLFTVFGFSILCYDGSSFFREIFLGGLFAGFL